MVNYCRREGTCRAINDGAGSGRECAGWPEDNIFYSRGVLATNLSLLKRMKAIALAMGKEIASPAEARQILALGK